MKKFLVLGLLAAIGAVAMVSQSSAASRYCIYNPDDPACYNDGGYPPPPPPDYGDGDGYGGDGYPPPPPPHPRHHHHVYQDGYDNGFDPFYDNYYDTGPVFSLHLGQDGNRCNQIAASLRRSGFHNVRAVDCAGRDYAFLTSRDGQRLKVYVRSSNGRIKSIRPY
jgi:hypothetical protein